MHSSVNCSTDISQRNKERIARLVKLISSPQDNLHRIPMEKSKEKTLSKRRKANLVPLVGPH